MKNDVVIGYCAYHCAYILYICVRALSFFFHQNPPQAQQRQGFNSKRVKELSTQRKPKIRPLRTSITKKTPSACSRFFCAYSLLAACLCATLDECARCCLSPHAFGLSLSGPNARAGKSPIATAIATRQTGSVTGFATTASTTLRTSCVRRLAGMAAIAANAAAGWSRTAMAIVRRFP